LQATFEMSSAEYDLAIAVQAKPFPWGPLAVAMYINSCEASPIAIKPLSVENVRPMTPGSSLELTRRSEYVWFGN